MLLDSYKREIEELIDVKIEDLNLPEPKKENIEDEYGKSLIQKYDKLLKSFKEKSESFRFILCDKISRFSRRPRM